MPSSQWVFDHFRFDPDHACLWRDAEAVVLPPPEAERRRLTVLFCDLVGSTTLAGHTWTRKTCGRWCVPIIRPVPR